MFWCLWSLFSYFFVYSDLSLFVVALRIFGSISRSPIVAQGHGSQSYQPVWIYSSHGSVEHLPWSSTFHTWCGHPLCWRAPWPTACNTWRIGNTPHASIGPCGWAPDGKREFYSLAPIRKAATLSYWTCALTFVSTEMARWHCAQELAQNLVWQRTHTGLPSLRTNRFPPRSSRQ